MVPALVPFAMFLTYVATGNDLTVDTVFAILALMNIIRIPMQQIPRVAGVVTQALVSVSRIGIFLSMPDHVAASKVFEGSETEADVSIQNASLSWGGEQEKKVLQELARTAP